MKITIKLVVAKLPFNLKAIGTVDCSAAFSDDFIVIVY